MSPAEQNAPNVAQGNVAGHPYCNLPPAGWWCSLQAGHTGPCPTRPAVESTDATDLFEAASVLALLVRAHKINASVRGKNETLTEHQKDCYAAALLVLGLPPDYLGPEFIR